MSYSRKRWAKLDALQTALVALQNKYADGAIKEVIKIFGNNFHNNPYIRLSALEYMNSVDLSVAMAICTHECKIDQKRKEDAKNKRHRSK